MVILGYNALPVPFTDFREAEKFTHEQYESRSNVYRTYILDCFNGWRPITGYVPFGYLPKQSYKDALPVCVPNGDGTYHILSFPTQEEALNWTAAQPAGLNFDVRREDSPPKQTATEPTITEGLILPFNGPITSAADVQTFFHALLSSGVSFHPDDTFKDTTHRNTGIPTFTAEEATRLDSLMDEAADVCNREGIDICGVALDCFTVYTRSQTPHGIGPKLP